MMTRRKSEGRICAPPENGFLGPRHRLQYRKSEIKTFRPKPRTAASDYIIAGASKLHVQINNNQVFALLPLSYRVLSHMMASRLFSSAFSSGSSSLFSPVTLGLTFTTTYIAHSLIRGGNYGPVRRRHSPAL